LFAEFLLECHTHDKIRGFNDQRLACSNEQLFLEWKKEV